MEKAVEFCVVKRGDALGKIAVMHRLALERILEWNPQIDGPDVIRPRSGR
nr:LysM domain-containing protein [Streptomyces azureus]